MFDAYLCVDWSGRGTLSPPRESPDAVWVAEGAPDGTGGPVPCVESYFRSREACSRHLRERLLTLAQQGRRVLVGFDFAFGYPAGYAEALALPGEAPPWRRLWSHLLQEIDDRPDNGNNRFAVASALNARCGGAAPGPLWGCPPGRETETLRRKSPGFPYPVSSSLALPRLRRTDRCAPGAQDVWKLLGVGCVGSQSLLGIPRVCRLRDDPSLREISRVWPFETGFRPDSAPSRGPSILHAEIWPGLFPERLDPRIEIRDRAQVRAVVEWAAEKDARGELGAAFDAPPGLAPGELELCVSEEGWILGGAGLARPPGESPHPANLRRVA